ncbi:hypothetical protein ACHAO8_011563, partial [Botrytis cinerea]
MEIELQNSLKYTLDPDYTPRMEISRGGGRARQWKRKRLSQTRLFLVLGCFLDDEEEQKPSSVASDSMMELDQEAELTDDEASSGEAW